MTRFDGVVLLDKHLASISPHGAYELNVCNFESQNGYGEILIEPKTNSGQLSGEVTRANRGGTYEFSSVLIAGE